MTTLIEIVTLSGVETVRRRRAYLAKQCYATHTTQLHQLHKRIFYTRFNGLDRDGFMALPMQVRGNCGWIVPGLAVR